jgi:hypothetical protein
MEWQGNHKRTAEEILKDLVKNVMEYNSLRDEEMDWEGMPEDWDEEIAEAYDTLVGDILKKRRKIERILREATGDKKLEF